MASTVPIFPVLLGFFPIAHLYATNVDRIPMHYIFALAGACLLATLVPLLLLAKITRNPAKAALALTWALVLFFAYGRVRLSLHAFGRSLPALWALADDRVLWPLFLAAIVAGVTATIRSRGDRSAWVAPLNVFATLVVAIALSPTLGQVARRPALIGTIPLKPPPNAPDVYFIVLDAYGRESALREFYGFDNAPFLNALRKRGFIVPTRNRASYLSTVLSLSSTLNLDDFDALRPPSEKNTERWLGGGAPLLDLIESNRVARSFKAAGYRYVVLPSGLSFTNGSRIADVQFGDPYGLREFNLILGRMTMLAPWLNDGWEQVTPSGLVNLERRLLDVPSLPGPKFVFAHFLSPHPPYQFRADGSQATKARPGVKLAWSDRAGYVGQVRYLNAFVLRAIDRILAQSKTPPLIVLQGDHGPALRDETAFQSSLEPWGPPLWRARSENLSALLVPPAVRSKIPDDLTSVNSFRLLFREVYGANLLPLPNHTYYSNLDAPYRFLLVPPSEASR